MATTIYIKEGDTARAWTDTLTLDGDPIDLTDATVVLVKRRVGVCDSEERLEADIVSSAAGTVSYQPLENDVEIAGTFELEWEITFSDDSVLTVPTSGYIRLIILRDLG